MTGNGDTPAHLEPPTCVGMFAAVSGVTPSVCVGVSVIYPPPAVPSSDLFVSVTVIKPSGLVEIPATYWVDVEPSPQPQLSWPITVFCFAD